MNSNSSSQTDKIGKPAQPMIARQQKLAELCRSNGRYQARLPDESFLTSQLSDQFLFWFPDRLPKGDSVSVSSSRLGQKLDQHVAWFDALRTLAVQLQNRGKFLISAQGTTTHPFISRIATLFRIPLLEFKPFPSNANQHWFKQSTEFRRQQTKDINPLTNPIVWFEQIEPVSAESKTKLSKTKLSKTKLSKGGRAPKVERKFNIDDLLVGVAACAVLLSVRNSGKTLAATSRRLKILGQRLSEPNVSTETSTSLPSEVLVDSDKTTVTKLLINRELTSRKTEANLLSSGARGWWLYHSKSLDPPNSQAISLLNSRPPNSQSIQPTILAPDEVHPDQFLIHWTRRRVGPWPDQTYDSFLDDLIFRNSRSDHSQLSSLCRILASQKIIGSANLTRDTKPVVCFSNLPIAQLKQRRVFRPHLSRWDFEPYGLAIDRDLLKELGARRVVYGDDSSWETLSASERPFFQTRRSANQKIDWELEREWRIVGDLRLKLIPRDRAFVFVASKAQANVVASLCHWPVVVLNADV